MQKHKIKIGSKKDQEKKLLKGSTLVCIVPKKRSFLKWTQSNTRVTNIGKGKWFFVETTFIFYKCITSYS